MHLNTIKMKNVTFLLKKINQKRQDFATKNARWKIDFKFSVYYSIVLTWLI